MTRTAKLSMAGGLALLAGIGLMTLIHHLAWRSFGAAAADAAWPHHGMRLAQEMPWFTPLAPLTMALTIGGIVLLVVSLVRAATRNG